MREKLIYEILDQHQDWIVSLGKKGKKADLRNQDLRDINFSAYSLKDAFLQNVILSDKEFTAFDLNGAFLAEADLKGANFQNANLSGAFLIEADLRGCNMQNADLQRADLTGAKVENVSWENCMFSETIFDYNSLIQLPQELINNSEGKIFSKYKNITAIVRKVQPKKEAYDASIGIMGYFAKVLKQLGYHHDAKVRVEPAGDNIVLSVEVNLDIQEVIKEQLDLFFDVLSGVSSPDLLYDEMLSNELKNKIDIAKLEVALNSGLIKSLTDIPSVKKIQDIKLLEQATMMTAFIIHGRDQLEKEKVARFIQGLDIKPIILSEMSSGGKTIIEKIEQYTDVSFAIVLYTADDIGRLKDNNHEKELKGRARQNVVFEHGYLMARLGRDKVCALIKGEIEMPSDINGLMYIKINDGNSWKFDLAKEIKEAGVEIDLNKIT